MKQVRTESKYESPKFNFQELKIAEDITPKCWGYHTASSVYFWDKDGDDRLDKDEPHVEITVKEGDCNSVEIELKKAVEAGLGSDAFKAMDGADKFFCKTNSQSETIIMQDS